MSFKALRLANKTQSANPGKVISAKQALPVLGIDKIKNLALSTYVTSSEQEYQEELYRHSLACACASRLIGRHLYPEKPLKLDSLFTLGLLHDLGKLVVFSSGLDPSEKPGNHEKAMVHHTHAGEKLASQSQSDHALIGSEFIAKNGLPAVLYQVARFHHQPRQASSSKELVMVVHLADYLANLLNGDREHSSQASTDEDAWNILGLEKRKIPDYLSQLKDEFQKSEVFLRISKAES